MPEFETTKAGLALFITNQTASRAGRLAGWMARASAEMVNGPSAGN